MTVAAIAYKEEEQEDVAACFSVVDHTVIRSVSELTISSWHTTPRVRCTLLPTSLQEKGGVFVCLVVNLSACFIVQLLVFSMSLSVCVFVHA